MRTSTIVLADDEAHHAVNVMRHKVGDIIVASDGKGMVYEAKIGRVSDSLVEAKILKERRMQNEPISSITVAQGIIKGSRMDYAVEKLTELGVRRIVPFISARSAVVPEEGGEKAARWRRIAIGAMKQSERSIAPEISEVTSFDKLLLLSKKHDLFLMGWEKEKRNKVLGIDLKNAKSVLLLVGPEGGFTEEEVEGARSAGAVALSLGERKLRAETASVVLAALVLERLGDI
jgi:16S rRNA (uracil1498-N3)-methyltransferase